MNKNFEKSLPEGYVEVFAFDANDKKTMRKLSLIYLLIIGLYLVILSLFTPINLHIMSDDKIIGTFILGMIGYIIAHELLHGLVYKVCTHQKLKYGFSLAVAYCGVPNIFVYRKTALLSLAAPLVMFSMFFIVLLCIVDAPNWHLMIALLFGIHLSGCVGDIYDIFLYLVRYKDKSILMNDTGPKQTFYAKE